ncbi:MAG: hypothetical protein ASARMPREDX12_003693 [Alectoria sarmentosa]|nr:MAG: hypothetical protein ASARMPREDX12_003693 [Alectoria sarmentosa]
MFYSHERGVATVWLVATLGSRSNSKKINRKAILNVDVPKTCSIIIQPEAPMALRLQSNLLYGVSRVFSQQCGYVLSDAQIAQSNMRALLKAVRTSDLDPNAGKVRPDQLVIQDDPAFLPDLALPILDIDLSAFDISTDSSRLLGLVIPSSYSGGAGDLGGFILPGENGSSAQRRARIGRLLDDEDEGFDIDPGFTIDADGNLVEERTPGPSAAPAGGMRLGSDSAASARVRQELMEGQQAGRSEPGAMDLDLDLPRFDDDIVLPDAKAFPTTARQAPGGPGIVDFSSNLHREQESSGSAEAPRQRKRRAPKPLPVDERQELHNTDLAQWKTDYLANMAEATEARMSHKAPFLAKKNAAFWVVLAGIGGVGPGLGSSKLQSPLDMFAGDAMMEALTGVRVSIAGQKRGRDDGEDYGSDSEVRRVRIRDDDGDQIGRGDDIMLDDDGTMIISANDGIEVGRHAPPALEDPSMPWNISSTIGSRQGSIVPGRGFASSIGGFPTSAGAPSSLLPVSAGPSSLDRRASRITSASPLVNRGRRRYSSIEVPPGEGDDELLGGRHISDDQAHDDFQLYGPAAAVDTQTAEQSQWMRVTLNQEANNFLDFVKTEIMAFPAHASDDEDELSGDLSKSYVSFERLLPPTQHSKIVAAQALHHLLALATKSLINVHQDSPDLRVELFGHELEIPLFIAPVGVQTIFHTDKELGVAEVGTEMGVPYILSTASSASIEDVAKASGDGLLRRAKSHGYSVLLVTLDTWALSRRLADLDNAFVPFASGIGDQTGFSDPVFRRKFKANGTAHTWEQLELLKMEWDGPIVLKEIQHVEDARLAVEAGMDRIVVSNHGGRQLDGAIGSLEVLLLGTNPSYTDGLAIGGKLGARDAVRGLLAVSLPGFLTCVGVSFSSNTKDLDQSMGLAGIANIADCNRSMIRRVQYGGDKISDY